MAKYAHQDVLDKGIQDIKDNATQQLLLKKYTLGDSYATVLANSVCTVVMVGADYSLSGADAADRLLTTASKTGTADASSGSNPDLHIAFTNGFSKVLWVTDEITDQEVVITAPVVFPILIYTSKQPT